MVVTSIGTVWCGSDRHGDIASSGEGDSVVCGTYRSISVYYWCETMRNEDGGEEREWEDGEGEGESD